MRKIIFITILTFAYSFNLRKAKQNYDSYVMAVQWPNGYCSANNCGKKADHIYKNTMTIHGLWPSLKNGKYLDTCTSGVTIEEDDTKLFVDLKQYWPSFSKPNTAFWEHEYNKHGYCMVEEYEWDGYEEYFEFVLELFLSNYKDLIIKAFPNHSNGAFVVSYEEMKEKIRKIIPDATFKMNCNKKYIYEFYFYLEKDFNPSINSVFTNSCNSGILVFN